MKIKTNKLRLLEIRKQKNFNKHRATNNSMVTSTLREQEQQTAQMTIKLLSPRT